MKDFDPVKYRWLPCDDSDPSDPFCLLLGYGQDANEDTWCIMKGLFKNGETRTVAKNERTKEFIMAPEVWESE
jgi:hypothetical protein